MATKENTAWHRCWVVNKALIQECLLYRQAEGDRTGALVYERNLNWPIASNQNLPEIQNCFLCLENRRNKHAHTAWLHQSCSKSWEQQSFNQLFLKTDIQFQSHLYEAFRALSHHFKCKLGHVTSRCLHWPEGESRFECVCFFCQWAEGPNLDL